MFSAIKVIVYGNHQSLEIDGLRMIIIATGCQGLFPIAAHCV